MTQATEQFTQKSIDAMNRAYQAVWEILWREGADHDAHVKAGARIVFLGKNGETDAHTLCIAALKEALGRLPSGLEEARPA